MGSPAAAPRWNGALDIVDVVDGRRVSPQHLELRFVTGRRNGVRKSDITPGTDLVRPCRIHLG
jgi:hypothetical protein